MTTVKDIELKHNTLWIKHCKSTVNDINVKESSKLYMFMSNMFLTLVKYYKKDRNIYNLIYKFLYNGNNFTITLIDTLMKFFKNVMKDDQNEKQYKNLFKKFKLKIQRENFMKTLHEHIEKLIENQQCIVHVQTETKEDNRKEYAQEIIKNNLLHQKELQVLRNVIDKKESALKQSYTLLVEKDRVIDSKDKTIENLQNDNLFLKTTIISLTKQFKNT